MQRDGRKKGFTLVELMLVVVIIGLLAGIAIPNVMSQLEKAKIGKAKADVTQLDNALELYGLQVGQFPTTDEGLNALQQNSGNYEGWGGPYLKRGLPRDPWGNKYIYKQESTHNLSYDLFSMGSDKQENTEDDIGNWNLEQGQDEQY